MTKKAPHGPQGIKVWQGYRSENYKNNREKFIEVLSNLFIPRTVQVMEPIGLCHYFPTILPESAFTLPDEISLTSYSSRDHYEDVIKTTLVGKAHDALRNHLFNFSSSNNIPQSKSGFPIAWHNKLKFGQAYYLCDTKINWRDNKTKVYCAVRLPHISPEKMRRHIEQTISVWRTQNTNVNGSILLCEKDYVLYWEHTAPWGGDEYMSSLFPLFAPVLHRPTISRKAIIKNVGPDNLNDYEELLLTAGCCADIRLMGNVVHTEALPVRLKIGEFTS